MDAINKAQYLEKGFIVVKNVVPANELLNLYEVVASVLHKHCKGLPSFSSQDPWNDPLFHAAMFKFRSEHPQAFGYLFDTVQTSVALWRVGTSQQLTAIAAELMDDTINGLSVSDYCYGWTHLAIHAISWNGTRIPPISVKMISALMVVFAQSH